MLLSPCMPRLCFNERVWLNLEYVFSGLGDHEGLGDHKGRPYGFQNGIKMIGHDDIFM